MNIKFGMDNFYVRYLKRFLNHELDMPTSLLGAFDKNDLQQVIKYLNLPNVKSMFEVQKEIQQKFTELKTLFNMRMKDDYIIYTSKNISSQSSDFLRQNIDNLKDYCDSVGWEITNISDWIDMSKDINGDGNVDLLDRQIISNIISGNTQKYTDDIIKKADINLDGYVDYSDLALLDNYMNNGKLYLIIQQSNRKNYFPNKDMLIFINQFDGTFLYDWAIDDGRGDYRDDTPHPSIGNGYKIALYACKPGQKLTIAHNGTQPVRLVIGGSRAHLKADIGNFELSNIIDITLKSGDYIQYTCTSHNEGTGPDVNFLCIQCPSTYGNLSGSKKQTLQLDTGDINFDGRIDMEDYHLLARYTATGPGSEQYKWTPTPKQLAVMNCRKDETDPDITIRDAEYLYRFINGDPKIPSLGFSYYDIEVSADYDSGVDITNFLIIDGHYDTDTNIPFLDFVNDDWIIHEKFFNYLFGIAINPYSSNEDIAYLQKLLQVFYPEHIYDSSYFQTGIYTTSMQNLLKEYQKQRISYTTGDLNKDNNLTYADLEVLRNYIDDSADYTLVQKYISDPIKYPLTEEEIKRLDRNGDNIIDNEDLDILNDELTTKYAELLRSRADINDDGFVDEKDYVVLKEILDNGYTVIFDEKSNKERKIDLKQYDIPFILGYCDVQTEAILESDLNNKGLISEVSK